MRTLFYQATDFIFGSSFHGDHLQFYANVPLLFLFYDMQQFHLQNNCMAATKLALLKKNFFVTLRLEL